jgi:hypothetical protein
MNPTTPQLTSAPTRSATPHRIAAVAGPTSPYRPTWGEVLAQTVPIIVAPAFFGPPVIFVLGPWLLLVLMLIGPFALILTLVLALALAGGLLAVFVAVIASPYLLIHHLHAQATVRAKPHAPVHLLPKHRVSSGRLGTPQPKGMS